MPYTPIPDQTVNGPWGAGPYPPWFEEIAQRQGMGGGPQKAAAFKNYVAQHPDWDFGEFWNQFRPGQPLANHQFYNPANGQPPPEDPPTQPDPNAAGGANNHVQTSRPTTPGGPNPGRWQRLVSFVNGVRQERWKWIEDPVAPTPTPTTPPAPTPQPPTPGPVDDTGGDQKPTAPYIGKPKPNPGGWQTPPINPTPQQAGGGTTQSNPSSLVAGAFSGPVLGGRGQRAVNPTPPISPSQPSLQYAKRRPVNPRPQAPNQY